MTGGLDPWTEDSLLASLLDGRADMTVDDAAARLLSVLVPCYNEVECAAPAGGSAATGPLTLSGGNVRGHRRRRRLARRHAESCSADVG
jgi:hypothetical protein